MNGNKENETLVGADLFAMVLFKKAYPHSGSEEVAVFIYDQTGGIFTSSQISTKLIELGNTRKRASTEAYQAFEPRNLRKFRQF